MRMRLLDKMLVAGMLLVVQLALTGVFMLGFMCVAPQRSIEAGINREDEACTDEAGNTCTPTPTCKRVAQTGWSHNPSPPPPTPIPSCVSQCSVTPFPRAYYESGLILENYCFLSSQIIVCSYDNADVISWESRSYTQPQNICECDIDSIQINTGGLPQTNNGWVQSTAGAVLRMLSVAVKIRDNVSIKLGIDPDQIAALFDSEPPPPQVISFGVAVECNQEVRGGRKDSCVWQSIHITSYEERAYCICGQSDLYYSRDDIRECANATALYVLSSPAVDKRTIDCNNIFPTFCCNQCE